MAFYIFKYIKSICKNQIQNDPPLFHQHAFKYNLTSVELLADGDLNIRSSQPKLLSVAPDKGVWHDDKESFLELVKEKQLSMAGGGQTCVRLGDD